MADTPALPERLSDDERCPNRMGTEPHDLSRCYYCGARPSDARCGGTGLVPVPDDLPLLDATMPCKGCPDCVPTRDLRRAAPVASPAEDDTWGPCSKNAGGEHYVSSADVDHCCFCGADYPYPSEPVASPRREAPADAVEALAAVIDPEPTDGIDRMLAINQAKVVLAAGYQLVPADHHVSPEGQTVREGVRYEVEKPQWLARWRRVATGEAEAGPALLARLRPVGTEEADTDGRL